ncbi:MAG: RNA methyltransferase [Lachnospiraceae bacterium]|nr:RNA methyltransferase [Lachnospiraceae bacterium]
MAEKIKVSDFTDPETKIYNMRSETMLYRMNEPAPGIFISETELVIRRALAAGYEPISLLVLENELENLSGLIEECEKIFITADRYDEEASFPVYYAAYETIKDLIGFPLTRGVLCAMKRKKLPDVNSIIANARNIAVFCDIENPTNTGTIFRNAAALGIDAVILHRNCSDPLYRRSLRAGMGCQFAIPWTSCDDLNVLKENGFHFAAFALRDDALTLEEFAAENIEKKALLLGNEGFGLSDDTLALCDSVIKIPMREGVDSLNVAVASGIAFYELTK